MKIRILIPLFILLMVACQKDDVKNNEASLLKMSFDFGDVIFDGNEGTIKAPENTDLEKLTPTIKISEGAIVYPPSKAITDFTEPVDYTVTSEDQNNVNYYNVSVILPLIKFSVFDCSNCTKANPIPEKANDALVKIYKKNNESMEKILEIETDGNGEALFYADKNEIYFATVEKGSAKFTKNGYLIGGVYQNEGDWYQYCYFEPDAQVGDLILLDVNCDGQLSNDDKMEYLKIWYKDYNEETHETKIYIAN